MNRIYDDGGLPGERSRHKNCPVCNLGCPECQPEEEEEILKLKLDDDTSWPDPRFAKNVALKLQHNPDDLTECDRMILFGCAEAYCRLLTHLEQIILDNSTVHAPCDTRYIARCNPQKEQEMGREQVLDEIRELLSSLKNETK